MKSKDIKWTIDQEKLIEEMIKEAESIGYTEGWDEAIRGIINELRNKLYRK